MITMSRMSKRWIRVRREKIIIICLGMKWKGQDFDAAAVDDEDDDDEIWMHILNERGWEEEGMI
jgi:hypothetical protein